MPTESTARVERKPKKKRGERGTEQHAPNGGMESRSAVKGAEGNDAIETFRSYAAAFQRLDARAVARHFHEPALLLAPHAVFLLSDAAAAEETYRRVLGDAAARGYARTEFSPLLERHLADDLAVISGNGAWKKDSGEELRRFGVTYTLRKVEGRWQIVVAAIHDPTPPKVAS